MTYKLDTTVNILGTPWTIIAKTLEEDHCLQDVDGYTDFTDKTIIVADRMHDDLFHNPAAITAQAIRHEIIHAFLFESGLAFNFEHPEKGHDETTIDWLAIQWPKINNVLGQIFATVRVEE